MSDANKAVFLSYAREDADAARRIADALRAFGIEVWFDQEELHGGDAWDTKIRGQIKSCALFVPIVSAQTEERTEGYFRREWKLAVDRSHDMAGGRAFIVPVVIDDTAEAGAAVPEEFMKVQWTRLAGAAPTPEFVAQVKRLLDGPKKPALKTDNPKPATSPDFQSSSRSPVAGVGDPGGPASARPATRKAPPIAVAIGLGTVLVSLALIFIVARRDKPAAPDPKSQPGLRSLGEGGTPGPKPAMVTIPAAPRNNKSLTVLPFTNLSPDKENEFFASGIHEEILAALQTMQDLRVIQYRGADKSIRQLGSELNVAFALECSVRREGSKVRVTGKLTDTRTEELVWVDKFEGELTDVFAIQTQLAKAIAGKLSAVIAPAEQSVIERRPTTNVAAYDLYLKAKDIRNRSLNTESAIDRTEALLRSAVELDPNFAAAWGELATARAFMYTDSDRRTPEQLAKARAALTRLQQLAPGDAETYRTEGNFHYFTARDYPRAIELYQKALALRPNDPESYMSFCQVLRRTGQWAAAMENFRKAIALDPRSDRFLRNASETADFARHYDEALAYTRQREDRDDDLITPRYRIAVQTFRARGSTAEGDQATRGSALVTRLIWAAVKGDFKEVARLDSPSITSLNLTLVVARSLRGLGDDAAAGRRVAGWVEKLQVDLAGQPGNGALWMNLAEVQSILGRHDEALASGRKAVELTPESVDAWQGRLMVAQLARIAAWAGKTDDALRGYAIALANGGANVHQLRADAQPAALKQDPRFLALLNDPKNNQPLF